ncbi:Prephenate dehydratase [ANME-1 cluster archaeon GoMg1]|nr:Prephenate dehydratase [ANME-1 cluster archaeon GoMg1]
MKVGILGPAGTFSEDAAELWLKGRNENLVEMKYYETIFDVSESLLRKEVDYGIVPIENSLEGSVGETLDVLSSENREEIQIVGEVLVPINICLLAQTFKKSLIKTVVSHPHALAQCKQFIREQLKGVEVKSVDSTASAAKLASQSEEIAALASKAAAQKYGLNILEENVQSGAMPREPASPESAYKDSVTRFVVLSSSASGIKTAPTGRDKTSVLIYLKDYPGALYDVLGEFVQRGINLTKIESRPSKRALGDYMFHIDCEGHIEEEKVKETLRGVESKVAMLKILGAYPIANSNEK